MVRRPDRLHRPSTDGNGDLLDFARPSVAVDIAVLTVASNLRASAEGSEPSLDLAVLLLRRSEGPHAEQWGLPGSFVRERERLADAVLRTLVDKCGIEGLAPRQLHVFDDPERDDRGWVMSVAHVEVVPVERLTPARSTRSDLTLAPVQRSDVEAASLTTPTCAVSLDGQRSLPFDHDEIVALAVDDLRGRYRSAPDPARLLPEPFTLLQLRRIHEAIAGEPLQKDTFRRQMAPHLEETDEFSERTVGRPARLFRHPLIE